MRELFYAVFVARSVLVFVARSRIWIPAAWLLSGLAIYQHALTEPARAFVDGNPTVPGAFLAGFALTVVYMIWTWIRAVVRNAIGDPFWTLRSRTLSRKDASRTDRGKDLSRL